MQEIRRSARRIRCRAEQFAILLLQLVCTDGHMAISQKQMRSAREGGNIWSGSRQMGLHSLWARDEMAILVHHVSFHNSLSPHYGARGNYGTKHVTLGWYMFRPHPTANGAPLGLVQTRCCPLPLLLKLTSDANEFSHIVKDTIASEQECNCQCARIQLQVCKNTIASFQRYTRLP